MHVSSLHLTAIAAALGMVASAAAGPLALLGARTGSESEAPAELKGSLDGSKFMTPDAVPFAPPRDAKNFTNTLVWHEDGPGLTFNYSTPWPDRHNRIGIWEDYWGVPRGKPEGGAQSQIKSPLVWLLAPLSSGSVKLSIDGLKPGRYRAYFFDNEPYRWLTEPVEVVIPSFERFRFLVGRFTTHNARVGDPFKAVIGGLLTDMSDAKATYSIVKSYSADWVSLSETGTITGTPTEGSAAEFDVIATGSDGNTDILSVTIPVVESDEALVDQLNVVTLNMADGGRLVKDYHRKQVNFLNDYAVDVVGLQQSKHYDSFRLAKTLGWYAWQGSDVAILSRYPIVESLPETGAGCAVRIAIDGGDSQIVMWNARLNPKLYGPYGFAYSGWKKDRNMENEWTSGRGPQIIEILDQMEPYIANSSKVPVILTGDFNAPSHLDWTNTTAHRHGGVDNVDWPTSVLPTKRGLIDSFREAHSDPALRPGDTWSPVYRFNLRHKMREIMDRIDFIYHKGLKTLLSEAVVVGSPREEPLHTNNEWTSDHAAVFTRFEIPNLRNK